MHETWSTGILQTNSARVSSDGLPVRLGLRMCGFSPFWLSPGSGCPPPIGRVWNINRDVRPILAENCFACHGPDSAARKADLRLDRRDDAIEAGAIAPGDAGRERAGRADQRRRPEEPMPPPATTKKLTPAQKDVLQRWIAEGAEYQPHWSLIAPGDPTLPAVQERRLGPQPDRPLRPGQARGKRPEAGTRGRPPDAGPPARAST